MTEQKAARIRLIYGVVLSVLIVTIGVAFATSCIFIYQSGSRPFSPESIGTHFGRIAIPVYLCLAAVIGGGVLELCLPSGKARARAFFFPTDRLYAKMTDATYSVDVAARIRREQRMRLVLGIATAVFWVGCAIPALIYLLNTAHFPNFEQNPTPEVLAACRLVLPLAVTALAFTVATTLWADASATREAALRRTVSAEQDAVAVPSPVKAVENNARVAALRRHAPTVLRILIPVLAAICIVLGILGGDVADVLGKAIRICTECIGLG